MKHHVYGSKESNSEVLKFWQIAAHLLIMKLPFLSIFHNMTHDICLRNWRLHFCGTFKTSQK